jgi:MFS transporter, PAT family, solute carrier family 33 (acetyl-CoA transportor), member 1
MTIRKRSDSADRKKLLQDDTRSVDHHEKSDLNGEWGNIAILFFLYLLQGIPLGIGQAIPMLLQNRGASYKQQAEFSFAYWPFSRKIFRIINDEYFKLFIPVKLLWAPIVDSLYIKALGRRKSWMVPTQYLIGLFMLVLSNQIGDWLGDGEEMPKVSRVTLIFFSLNFLAATQDIAVDGWALTMLKKRNVGHASTCNSVGQTAGYFLGYVVFMALESTEFCNKYIYKEPQNEGLVNLAGFLKFWGFTFLLTTTLVAFFKREKEEALEKSTEHPEYSVMESYTILWKIVKMKPVLTLAMILMSVKVSFAACDAVTTLKLVDHGIPKEKLALLAIPLVPLQILLPLIISKHTTGRYPMNLYIKAIPFRLLLTLAIAMLVWSTPLIIKGRTKDIPLYYYVMILVIYSFYQIFLYGMFCGELESDQKLLYWSYHIPKMIYIYLKIVQLQIVENLRSKSFFFKEKKSRNFMNNFKL